MEKTAAAPKPAAAPDALGERLDRIEAGIVKIDADQDVLVDDIERLATKTDDLIASLESRDGGGADEAPAPPALDWTEPALFEAARKAADEVGIVLTKDEVRIPARMALMQGVSGKPIRFSRKGVTPPEGETVHLFVSWQENGKEVIVRAEDLVWNRIDERPMEKGRWIYVGSNYLAGEQPGETLFAADLTGEAVATYSSVLVATPRMPERPENVALIIRRTDREPTKTFPAIVTGDPPAEAPGDDSGEDKK
jgi:hypothetical protein